MLSRGNYRKELFDDDSATLFGKTLPGLCEVQLRAPEGVSPIKYILTLGKRQGTGWRWHGKPRLEFAGAIYHVLSRGNYRQELFDHGSARLFEKTLL